MKIISTAVPAGGKGITYLTVDLEKGERIKKGDMIELELLDGSTVTREVLCMAQNYTCTAGQIRECRVCKRAPEKQQAEGECRVRLAVPDVDREALNSKENRDWMEFVADIESKVCITPYKELNMGEESIYDYVESGYSVPDRVIRYLQTTEPLTMSLGIYPHPFKKNVDLTGPYMYTDGKYSWDRDTWKYIVKYGLKVPQDFIDHVMSEEGEAYLRQSAEKNDSWSRRIADWKQEENTLCLLPEDAGDMGLEDF